jgi:uncharacterized protein DUF3105
MPRRMPPKKKPKTPQPPRGNQPRRVQAPQVRAGSRTGDPAARQRAILYGIAGSGVVALIAVILLVVLGGGSSGSKDAAKALAAAGCQYRHYPAQPRSPHYLTLTPNPPPHWNSFPPTSGRHYGQWVLWGDYTDAQPLIKSTHNLEHGGVIIQYGNKVPQADIAKINDFWQSDPNAMLVAPLPKLGNKIALTAWTQWAECTHFNQNAFAKFRSAFRYHGPESPVFPKSALEPGK